MTLVRSVAFLVACLMISAGSAGAQFAVESANDESLILPVIPEPGISLARPSWGGDVRITDAYLAGNHKGQVVSVADTIGGIYVAVNEVYLDTLSRIMVYRSTNGGTEWTAINGFRNSKYPIGSFDMCISDSSGGNWILGIAFTIKSDAGTVGVTERHGGSLYWGSMRTDGTHWRVTTISGMTTSTCYREPSICTNGGGASVSSTRFYVAAVRVSRADNQGWKAYVNSSSDWGDTWPSPDTTIAGVFIEYPTIVIDWSSTPDSLCVAFSSFEAGTNGFPGRDACVARNTYNYPNAWVRTVIGKPTDDVYPSMAIDQGSGDIIVSYSRTNGSAADAMYCYSSNQFRSYVSDSIATTAGQEVVSAVNCYLSGPDHCWRVAYSTNSGSDTLYLKAITNKLNNFFGAARLVVNQYPPDLATMPSLGPYRRDGGSTIGLYCVYAGRGSKNVYFDASGLSVSGVSDESLPRAFALEQNYPNPFNPTTAVRYQLPVAGWVRLIVYDVLGREVLVLMDERKEPGTYTATWDATGMASGVYIYRLRAGEYSESRKMVLAK
jgi:hypothetical protein